MSVESLKEKILAYMSDPEFMVTPGELIVQFCCLPATLFQALDELVQEGRITQIKKKKAYVIVHHFVDTDDMESTK